MAGSVGPQKKISLCSFIDRETIVSITQELIGHGNIDRISLLKTLTRFICALILN